eukprot:COSAG02_NODE_49108_length_329_cov_0.656522_1_plen_81_part_10
MTVPLPCTRRYIAGDPFLKDLYNAMRAQTFTLPFTEDYIFQIAAGSQEMYDLVIDVERAGIRPMPTADELTTLPPPALVAT